MKNIGWILRISIDLIVIKLLLEGFLIALIFGQKWLVLAHVIEFAIIDTLAGYYLNYLPYQQKNKIMDK